MTGGIRVSIFVTGSKNEVMMAGNEVQKQLGKQDNNIGWLGISMGEMRGIVAGRDGMKTGKFLAGESETQRDNS